MIIEELDDIKCEECYRLAIEDIAAFAIDPENLAKFEAENRRKPLRYGHLCESCWICPSQPAGVGQSPRLPRPKQGFPLTTK